MPMTHTIDIFKDFCEALKAKLSGLRLKHPGTVRILPQTNVIELEISFTGSGASIRTEVFQIARSVIVDYYERGDWVAIVDMAYATVEDGLRKKDLCASARTSPTGQRLRYRVISRLTYSQSPSAGGVNVQPPDEKVKWEGDDPATCTEKLGRMSTYDKGGVKQFTDHVLQKWVGQGWVDIPAPSRAVSRANPIPVPDALAAIKQAAASIPSLQPGPTQVKRQRQAQAASTRSAARSGAFSSTVSSPPAIPEMAKVLRGVGSPDDYKIAAQVDAETQRREEEQRRRRLEEAERRRKEAEERRRREEEERRRRERIARIRETARQPWMRAGGLTDACTRAWEEAALHEAEARGKQVEADLFGGGLDGDLDAGEKWVEAERCARELLTYAQERLEEAQARREGKGFESVYEDEEEILDAQMEAEAELAGQEHVDEAEFEEVAKQHVVAALQREEEEDIPPSEPPETGDEAMDELMGMSAPGLVTKASV